MIKIKKSQIWFLDFIVGLSIFMLVIAFYYKSYDLVYGHDEENWNEMIITSKTISNSLISQGYPSEWNETNVQRIGLINETYRIGSKKLDLFKNISYNISKGIFNTRFEYYFYLIDEKNNKSEEIGLEPSDEKSLVQTTRLIIYNSSIKKMVLQIWE